MLNILLADDDEDFRELVEMFLDDLDAKVTIAEEGDQAEVCLENQSFDLVISDVVMPTKDGMDLLGKYAYRTKILVISGAPEFRKACIAMGAVGYLSKPFEKGALLAEVIKLFPQYRRAS